jgi:hypothetical protein
MHHRQCGVAHQTGPLDIRRHALEIGDHGINGGFP